MVSVGQEKRLENFSSTDPCKTEIMLGKEEAESFKYSCQKKSNNVPMCVHKQRLLVTGQSIKKHNTVSLPAAAYKSTVWTNKILHVTN
jgi:hypothetical protein